MRHFNGMPPPPHHAKHILLDLLERLRLGRGLRRVVEDDEGLVLAQRADLLIGANGVVVW